MARFSDYGLPLIPSGVYRELIDEKARLMGSGKIDLYLIGGENLALRG